MADQIAISVLVDNLQRESTTTWTCAVSVPELGMHADSVSVIGATEEEALANLRMRVVFALAPHCPIHGVPLGECACDSEEMAGK